MRHEIEKIVKIQTTFQTCRTKAHDGIISHDLIAAVSAKISENIYSIIAQGIKKFLSESG